MTLPERYLARPSGAADNIYCLHHQRPSPHGLKTSPGARSNSQETAKSTDAVSCTLSFTCSPAAPASVAHDTTPRLLACQFANGASADDEFT